MLDLNHVHQTDCLAALTTIPDQSIPVVITDPPYPNGAGKFTDDLLDGLIGLYLSCKKAQRHVIFFWRAGDVPKPPPGWFEVARHLWLKPDAASRTPYEAIVVWSRERKYERCRTWNVPILSLRSLGDWKPHPTQKPIQLLRYIVEQYTKEGETVLDPFVGSGTTAVACKQLKRNFIAIEKNEEYAAIAKERLANRPRNQPTAEQSEDNTPALHDVPSDKRRRPSK
jgi:site-specific DNA-methyltransferase (adenine-specific)